MSLISPNETLQIAGILTGLAAFGFWVETTAIGRKASGVLIILCLGVLLSNIQIIPHSADAYGVVGSMLVPLAIPMLLFRADLKQVFAEVGPMLKAFIASALVIAVSIIVLTLAFDFGEYESKVAGTLAGSYIGGSLNFVATAQAVQLDDPNHYVAALTADTIGAVLFLILLMVMPALAFVRRLMPSRYYSEAGANLGTEAGQQETTAAKPFDVAGLAAAMAISFIICALADLISAKLGQESYSILIITILALLVANFMKPLVKRFNSEFEVGTFFMYMFFVTIGAGADIATIAGVALPYVVLICLAVAMFFVLILVVGRVLRLDLAELMVAANACILGPATAAALAAGQGWKDLVTPGMLTGILGYSVGTFIGVAVTKLLG
ncbi:DUF819 family protein [Pseudomonadales bacterium]|jgi:uncharacterized membrane protein|nr:DUF819 family protein [Gammaproteobacteria bacterium]MDA7726501.1 DUF819 family protein [Pseudomonadales bacterium]MBT3733618.1 DUF819 family protein [Gammaproteobacteria bacterium]MBT3897889.1 DUF819 family protein [Gammaproteobacteria bacterium]MBT7538288.1 DUF819 family protein [Gammaproteobacteria bacterium]